MNQNFTFMKDLADLVLDTKFITNRSLTEFRLQCDIGDIMHLFTGMRTKNCKFLGDAIVINREIWNTDSIPEINEVDKILFDKSPFKNLTWFEFIQLDGFDHYKDFYNYFKNRKEKQFIAYHFKGRWD